MSEYLLRSLMFVPGHNDKLIKKASKSNADVILLDIEDSVQPVANKQIAREKIKKYIEERLFTNHLIFPRVNDRESGELLKDVYNLTIEGIDGFMYPKAKTGKDIYFFDKLIETIEYEKGIEIGTFKIIPLIETTSAVLNVHEICKASNRVVAIAYGCEDFITDLEGIHDEDHLSLFTPRAMIAMAARANNIVPIDTVHINIHDLDDLEKNLKISKNLGFEGMLVLHPKELDLVHKYFSPSYKEIEDAQEMFRLAEEAKSYGKGVAILKGKFVGPPIVSAAKKILKKQKQIEHKNSMSLFYSKVN